MSVEAQVVNGLAGILSLVTSAGIAYVVPRVKKAIDAHVSDKTASVVNSVIDGLANIAQAVVQEFNQKIVVDAKNVGTWTPQLAQSVKADAVTAVKDQGAALVQLGQQVGVDVESLIDSLIESAVSQNHVDAPAPSSNTPAQAQS
ncbi:hypothetical protein AAC03nite_24720 [Alicyclobacillus acidoterrestris]|nr:hypothetical protein AAC03nite_24720 [Alicyclobacillus acidoterrestris]